MNSCTSMNERTNRMTDKHKYSCNNVVRSHTLSIIITTTTQHTSRSAQKKSDKKSCKKIRKLKQKDDEVNERHTHSPLFTEDA